MATYGVKGNNAGLVSVPLWESGAGNFTHRTHFKTGALTSTDGIFGTANANPASDYVAVYADGKYVLRLAGTSVFISPTGLLSASTEYFVEFGRTSGTSCYSTLYAANGTTVINTTTFVSSASFSFDRVLSTGSPSPLYFDGAVLQMDITGGTQARQYLSTVNTGTQWTETINAQHGTLLSLATDGSEWVLFTAPSSPVAISFTGTVPTQTEAQSSSASIDLSSYFSGTETPFTYAVTTGTLPAGLSLNTGTGVITGTPTTIETQSIVVTATDTATNTAATNAFNIDIVAATALNVTFDGDSRNVGSGAVSAIPIPNRVNTAITSSFDFTNVAVGGQQTSAAVTNYAANVTPTFDGAAIANIYIINGFGINDISGFGGGTKTSAQIIANLTTLANNASADGFDVVIATIPPRDTTPALGERYRQEVNHWILSNQLATVTHVIDLNADRRIGVWTTQYYNDVSHLKDEGQDIWANIIIQFLIDNYSATGALIATGSQITISGTPSAIPDGTFKTLLINETTRDVVFDSNVLYSANSAVVSIPDIASEKITGHIVDNEATHIDGAVITGVTS